VRYAYRRFGPEEGTPLVFLSHFRAGLDNWDPAVTDGLANGRPVILFNNAGVASSSGEPADTIDASADHVARLSALWACKAVDVLGFSIGGYVAQASSSVIPTGVATCPRRNRAPEWRAGKRSAHSAGCRESVADA